MLISKLNKRKTETNIMIDVSLQLSIYNYLGHTIKIGKKNQIAK